MAPLLNVRAPSDAAGWPAELTALVLRVTGQLARWTREGVPAATVVLTSPAPGSPQGRAARDAVRGLVHASTLEQAGLAVNLVVAGPDAPDLTETLAFLAGDGGRFVRGATVELGGRT